MAQGPDRLRRSHRAFWHAYYPQSFVSLPNARLESFYWIQMYKLASATRADRPAIDTLGPWYARTPWPGIWWNLNIQLSYWPVYTANRLALGESLLALVDRNQDNLRDNVPACSPPGRGDGGGAHGWSGRRQPGDLHRPARTQERRARADQPDLGDAQLLAALAAHAWIPPCCAGCTRC